MPIWTLEVAAGLLLLWTIARLVTVRAGRLLVTFLVHGVAAVVAVAAGRLAGDLADGLTRNFLARFVVVVTTGAAAYGLSAWGLGRRASRRDQRLARALDEHIPRWIGRTVAAAGLLILAGLVLVVLELGGRIAAAGGWRQAVEQQSLVLRYFLPSQAVDATPHAGPPQPDPVAEAPQAVSPQAGPPPQSATQPRDATEIEEMLRAQRRLLAGLGRTFHEARSYIAEATGAEALARQLQALRQLTDLPYEDQAWLVRNNPDILALLENPTVARVIRSNRIGELIDQAAGGSAVALYRLGDEPDIQQLLEDPQVRRVAARIDAVSLLDQLQAHKAEARKPVPVRWQVSEMSRTTDMRSGLRDPVTWRESRDAGKEGEHWPRGTAFGVLRAVLPPAPAIRLLTVRTSGRPSVWFDTEPLSWSQAGRDGHWLVTLPGRERPSVVEIVIDFRDTTEEPAAQVWLAQ